MGQAGQHVLIVEDGRSTQMILDTVMQRSGRRVTLAETYDQAVAVLRSSLHPLVVYVDIALQSTRQGDDPLLLDLLANPDFAATHAFIVISMLDGVWEDTLRERVAQTCAGYVSWLRLPSKVSRVIAEQEAAEAWLAARGG
ncbi:MAG TPA: response regulator [Ktedonobacterales bacterium]